MGIERIGVVGSGIMGSGIAEVAATSGHEVVLRSRKLESAQAMRAALEKSLASPGPERNVSTQPVLPQ